MAPYPHNLTQMRPRAVVGPNTMGAYDESLGSIPSGIATQFGLPSVPQRQFSGPHRKPPSSLTSETNKPVHPQSKTPSEEAIAKIYASSSLPPKPETRVSLPTNNTTPSKGRGNQPQKQQRNHAKDHPSSNVDSKSNDPVSPNKPPGKKKQQQSQTQSHEHRKGAGPANAAAERPVAATTEAGESAGGPSDKSWRKAPPVAKDTETSPGSKSSGMGDPSTAPFVYKGNRVGISTVKRPGNKKGKRGEIPKYTEPGEERKGG